MAFVTNHRFVSGVPRLSNSGLNVRQWKHRLDTYATTISGEGILKGTTPNDGSEEWKRIDDELRNIINSTIGVLDLAMIKATETAAGALSLIEEHFHFHVAEARMKVYSEFHALSAANFKSAEAFTATFMAQLAAMEKEDFSTVPLEMCLRFLIALEPVLPVYCRHRRGELYHGLPISLDAMIADLPRNFDTDKAFKDSYRTSERARRAKGAADTANGRAKNIAKAGSVCLECGSAHPGLGQLCYASHPELAPEKWVRMNTGKIVDAREYRERQQNDGGVTGFSSSVRSLMGARLASTGEALMNTEMTYGTEARMDLSPASDTESESGGGCALDGVGIGVKQ